MTSLDIHTLTEFSLPQSQRSDRRGPARWIASHAARYWYLLVSMLVGALGNAALAALVPILIGQAINLVRNSPDKFIGSLIRIALVVAVSQIVRSVLQLARNFSAELLGQRLERDIREELYVSLLGKSMTFHSLLPVGDTMARATNDVREINFMFSPGVNLAVGSLLFMVVPFFIIPRFHVALLLAPSLFVVLYVLALARYLKTMTPVTDEVRETFGDMNTHLSEALDGVEIMKGAAQEGAETETFVTNARRVRDAFVRQGDIEARFIPTLLYGLALAGGLIHALILFRMGLLNTGGVIAYFGLLRMLDFPRRAGSRRPGRGRSASGSAGPRSRRRRRWRCRRGRRARGAAARRWSGRGRCR